MTTIIELIFCIEKKKGIKIVLVEDERKDSIN